MNGRRFAFQTYDVHTELPATVGGVADGKYGRKDTLVLNVIICIIDIVVTIVSIIITIISIVSDAKEDKQQKSNRPR